MRQYFFQADAEEELTESARRYEERRPGLGDDFLAEVQELVARLVRYPESAPVIVGDVRRARVHRFPFDLIYRVRSGHIEVVAVMHQRRRPGYWKNRL